ncbi:MAG: 4Fe-4S dicluster domain-containing protein [Oceanidesulfovibrio sp.]
MATTARIDVPGTNPVQAVQEFLKLVLRHGEIGGVFVQTHLNAHGIPMPTLITNPDQLDKADPFAPAFPMNAARMAARLTHGRSGERVAAVLRPCEIRAFVELVKLNQGSVDEILLIGFDCLGAYDNRDYPRYVGGEDPMSLTPGFLGKTGGSKDTAHGDFDIADACLACENCEPLGADIGIGLVGLNLQDHLVVTAHTPQGEAVLSRLGLTDVQDPPERRRAMDELIGKRTAHRDAMFERTRAATSSLAGLSEYFARCVNCYNCRAACPVCYCKECVFLTDVFDHKPWQYMGWAKHKGMLKMPTDTLFFHLTRLAHMSTTCVGCGQCSNACPNGIPVMELFRAVGARTQEGFDYMPGRSFDEPPPLSVFKADEFPEVAGAD